MTLYELVILAKCAQTKATTNLARSVASSIMSAGGNVRDVKVLSDRILPRPRKCNDYNKYLVGRYLQVLFDGNPMVANQALKKAQSSYQTMKLDLFRIQDFYTHSTQFTKQLESSRVINTKDKQDQTITKILNAKKSMA